MVEATSNPDIISSDDLFKEESRQGHLLSFRSFWRNVEGGIDADEGGARVTRSYTRHIERIREGNIAG